MSIQHYLFSEFTKSSIPEVGGVYFLLGHPHLGKFPVLYVGKTNNLRERFGQHLNSDDLRIKKNVFFYNFEIQRNALLRDDRERELIKLYDPPYNVMLKPKLKPASPIPDRLIGKLAPGLKKTLPVSSPMATPQLSTSPLKPAIDRLAEIEKQRQLDALIRALRNNR